jgi:hypothetical protein
MVCHSSYVRFSSFPISGRLSSSAPSSVCPPTSTAQSPAAWPSSSMALCDRCRRERLAVARNGGGGELLRTLLPVDQPELLLALSSRVPRVCCWPQLRPPSPATNKPLELLLQVGSLLSPSCIFAEVCIYFPIECVGSTIFMDGFFSLNKKLLCA